MIKCGLTDKVIFFIYKRLMQMKEMEGIYIMSKQKPYCLSIWGLLLLALLCTTAGRAEAEVILSKGQTVYVPVYSHIYSGPKSNPVQLNTILSIRNTDPAFPIIVTKVDYYDSEGKLIRKYLTEEVRLNAMASTRYLVQVYDKTGGSGANFIVRWHSKEKVNAPIIEGIMTGDKGISFVSRGQVIQDAR